MNDGDFFKLLLVVGAAVMLVVWVAASGSSGDATASHPDMVRAIEAQGFESVKLRDYGVSLGWEGCDKNDTYVAHAVGTNAFGNRVELIACSGMFFKGVTVRTTR